MDKVVIEPTEIVDVGEGAAMLVVLRDGLVVRMELAASLEQALAKAGG